MSLKLRKGKKYGLRVVTNIAKRLMIIAQGKKNQTM